MPQLIKGDTVAAVWDESIRRLLKTPREWVPTERGGRTIELTDVILHVVNPLKEPRYSLKYSKPEEFSSTYGDRLFDQHYHKQVYSRISDFRRGDATVNQAHSVRQRITEAWYSRRAVVSVWDAFDDGDSDHPPCICLLQYLVRNTRLNVTAYFRSNDAWLCALLDMNAVIAMQQGLAYELGVAVGEYTHHAASYHIYDYDVPAALKAYRED
jgi:thymidylate synthase